MPPPVLSLSDDELSRLMNIAAVVPIQHRGAFLQAVAAELQRRYANTSTLKGNAKYR